MLSSNKQYTFGIKVQQAAYRNIKKGTKRKESEKFYIIFGNKPNKHKIILCKCIEKRNRQKQ